MSCWRDAFVCIVCLLIVAVVGTQRFAMCKWIVPVIVSAVIVRIFVCREAGKMVIFGISTLRGCDCF